MSLFQLFISRVCFFALLISFACHSQTTRQVGGGCEGCEALYEYGSKKLISVDTLPGYMSHEPKLKIYGRVFQKDARTPAPGVIVYIYHTNREGTYEVRGDEKGWAKRHGIFRGWVVTDADGRYSFYTFRPGAYPDGTEPEHIHITVKEPTTNEYYLDDFVFTDDPLLTSTIRKRFSERGGSGIVTPTMTGGILTVKRDIVLGKNIPDYE
jgi:protocatechuate 3,4-dioxygenase, beta subunit